MNTWTPEYANSINDAHVHVWREWVRYDLGTTSGTQSGVVFVECDGCGARYFPASITVRS